MPDHRESCNALGEQTELPLGLIIRINDWDRTWGSTRSWSVFHLICINTSSESRKTVITDGKADPPSQHQPSLCILEDCRQVFLPRPEEKGKSKGKKK